MGFQNNKPDTDFRGGGLLSLQIIIAFVEQEQDTVEEIVQFSKKYENFLFACVAISGVYYLKKHLHFGV